MFLAENGIALSPENIEALAEMVLGNTTQGSLMAEILAGLTAEITEEAVSQADTAPMTETTAGGIRTAAGPQAETQAVEVPAGETQAPEAQTADTQTSGMQNGRADSRTSCAPNS